MGAFKSIKQGLKEAKAFLKGQGDDARVHEISVPGINVAEIRAKTGLSQGAVAQIWGVRRIKG